MTFETILLDKQEGVGLITLNRPDALNALNSKLLEELGEALLALDADADIGAIVVTGSEKAFAAGADIKEMSGLSFADVLKKDMFAEINSVFARVRKPVIAAVSGYALGGGCEIAMACDFIIAAESAKFGQPEIKLGVIPGIGGSQRLTRLVGKSKAMDMMLTGRMMDSAEAERSGLVSRVLPTEDMLDGAMEVASSIADLSAPSVALAKEATNRALETTLAEGLLFERRAFHSLFATEDQKEGMSAFIEKRQPQFKNC
ncbi:MULTISPECIES: enoyl-CoA hydratase [Kordiimonas]|jgi:enoyl-CoA hydratase|uniref:enoyl-CoA hydratase n=1 Tax=Kordiimonas lacus TaxID=637679 RepID=A0A1G7EJM8_9PROT|nr:MULTISPECIES: enoyl-CoA hydratase [Kordiimonas]SDE63892.1 enoyl-CoA hydratase [Kordiimonas lacus]